MKYEEIMKQWDYWRGEIANGHKGSAPRDWFESILDYYEERIPEKEQSNSPDRKKRCGYCGHLDDPADTHCQKCGEKYCCR